MGRPISKPRVYKLKKDNFFVSKISTNTLQDTTDIAFLRAKTRLTPLENKKTYKEDVLSIKHHFLNFGDELIKKCALYDDKFILSITLTEDAMKYHKTTHLHYDLFVRTEQPILVLKHKDELENISNILESKLISLFEKYSFKCF